MQAHHNHNQPHEQQQNIQIQDQVQNIKKLCFINEFFILSPNNSKTQKQNNRIH